MSTRPAAETDDAALVRRVADGDVGAFETIYERYRSQAFGLALTLTRRRQAAEEVTQDAFMSLWRGAHSYDPSRASLATWLLSVVRYRAVDSLRRSARHERSSRIDDLLVDRLESGERLDERAVDRERARHARALVGGLPPEQRQVIELAYYGGLSQSEIAARVGVPIGTVKGRSRLALEKLRQAISGDSPLVSSG